MNFFKRLFREYGLPRYFFYMKCPACDGTISFYESDNITVNAESRKKVYDDIILFKLDKGCNSPFCKWSKIDGDCEP